MNDDNALKPVNPELKPKRIRPVTELPSVKRGFAGGIKYYYFIIMKEQAIFGYPELYEALVDFGSELADFLETENATSVQNMSTLFKHFYPAGKLHKVFESLQLGVALDGISECLYNLKKMYHLDKPHQ